MARPFLKWAGGKRQLIPELEARLPEDMAECRSYIEPFLGGGAVLFHMLSRFEFDEVHVSDINPELILCYKTLQESSWEVSQSLERMSSEYPSDKEGQKEYYYSMRDSWNDGVGLLEKLGHKDRIARSANTIFLNKTCFNGLFRVNRSGKFNVPCNYTKKPSFPKEEDLVSVGEALEGVSIRQGRYSECEVYASDSSFFYFDPPYRPLSDTSGFVSYSKEDFNDDDQRILSELYSRLDERGAKLMLSNSDPKNSNPSDDFFDSLYSSYNIDRVKARRSINSVGEGRGEITEIIVTNYEVRKWW